MFALDQHIQENFLIGITVKHQDVCSIAGRRLHSSDNDKNQFYVKIIDNL